MNLWNGIEKTNPCRVNHSKPVSFIENAVPLETEAVSPNRHCTISRKVVHGKILGIECERKVKVKVDTSFHGNLWILVLRDQRCYWNFIHTQNVLLYVLLCVLYGKNLYCLLIMLSIEHVLDIHTCICLLCK